MLLLAIASPWAPNFSVARKGTAAPSTVEVAPEVGFGKHRGETINDVVDQDSDYCLWVVETYKENPEKCRRELKEMAQWLLQNEPDLFNNSERKLGFGKHSDQTWDWVIENDKGYTHWCISKTRESEKSGGRLKAFAQYAMEKQQAEE